MITVVGGVYLERCLQPAWNRLLGSGGRAAVALAGVSDSVTLRTYVDASARRALTALTDSCGVLLDAADATQTVAFDYAHPLSIPLISPPRHVIRPEKSLDVAADVILRFGMMEGDAVVRGKRVIYDPQSATAPKRFQLNGSSADTLAIVANGNELRLLTGEPDAEAGARRLLDAGDANVVVAKRGSRGALVVTPQERTEVPAYRTELVFKIGSGDIFAAAFAHFWGEREMPPEEAAELASRATADYVESRSLSLADATALRERARVPVGFKPGKVYLAGPFFSMAQRWLVEEARFQLLGLGLEVFSPVHDVGPGPANVVAPADLAGLDGCDRVLALVDGADVGTIFEVGYARQLGRPVIALAETLGAEDLKMIAGSGCTVTDDFATAIHLVAWLP